MDVKLYEFRENDVYIKAEEHTLIALAIALREAQVEGTLSDLAYQIEYQFDIDGVRSEDEKEYKHPCDYGDCPFGAECSEDCRFYCGLGVDEDEEDYDEYDDCPLGGDVTDDCADCAYSCDYHFVNGECIRREEYVPSAENGDYSPSNPWDAPGMSIKDFI